MREGITSGFRPVAAHWSGSPQFVSGGRDRKSTTLPPCPGPGRGLPRKGFPGPGGRHHIPVTEGGNKR
ncbi:hypothetical protein B0293_01450 [Amycolatopsis azurea DSM 43854]|uniref:Uncharacterized protein n=1 Tax=Amycolatopsis azurea DSM 43854 TaxID=1238180 RepID=M2NSW3_9PSEU|nr:hypothetical protein C791_4810 [Amycolatopsis azurea DSM 43854]OOC08601.1 hypothetical protein B0293_01450 [Amycolatopsis azurea DSM 43854]